MVTALEWEIVARTADVVVLTSDGAALVIEAPRPAVPDPQLHDAIARLAPHLSFGPPSTRGRIVERVAIADDERVVVGNYTQGSWSIAYVLAARTDLDIEPIVARTMIELSTPFDHVTD